MQTLRFGKLAPIRDYRRLLFKTYKKPSLPPPPASYSNTARIYSALGITVNDIPTLLPMDGNDQYGDCTIAARSHAITTFRAFTAKKKIPTQAETLALYKRLTGGQDSGLAENCVLKDWKSTSSGDEELLAYASVRPQDLEDVKLAITLGGLYLGFQCQRDVIKQFNAHKPWTPGRLTQDGHAVWALDYNETGVLMSTWGALQWGTWAWWSECVDEAYYLGPQEAKTEGFCPGYDVDALLKDAAYVGTLAA